MSRLTAPRIQTPAGMRSGAARGCARWSSGSIGRHLTPALRGAGTIGVAGAVPGLAAPGRAGAAGGAAQATGRVNLSTTAPAIPATRDPARMPTLAWSSSSGAPG